MNTPLYIQEVFYKVLKGKISMENFESWLYNTSNLEKDLPADFYTELISLSYSSKFVINELNKLLRPLIDNSEFEIKRIVSILKSIVDRDKDCAESIELTYHLYCDGYIFLRRLGLKYGLMVSCPPSDNYDKTWDEMSEDFKQDLLDKFYPEIAIDAQNAINWFERGALTLLDEKDNNGDFIYTDNRNSEEIAQGEIPIKNLN